MTRTSSGRQFGARNPKRNRVTQHVDNPTTGVDAAAIDDLANQISGFSLSSRSFFEQFPEFDYKPESSLKKNFARLARSQHWEWNGEEYREQLSRMMEGEFARFYGTTTSRKGWQTLCEDLGIDPAPYSIDDCKEVSQLLESYIDLFNQVFVTRPCASCLSISGILSNGSVRSKKTANPSINSSIL